MFEKLMKIARNLGEHLDTGWAEEHAEWYDAFADAIETLYNDDKLSARQFNELACTAFFDYELKDVDDFDYDGDDIWGDEKPIYTADEMAAYNGEPDMGDMYGGSSLME